MPQKGDRVLKKSEIIWIQDHSRVSQTVQHQVQVGTVLSDGLTKGKNVIEVGWCFGNRSINAACCLLSAALQSP